MSRNVALLGDPHLGKIFRTGVPLNRRGDREKMVWKSFENSLSSTTSGWHVNLGDLFDKFVVPPEVVLRAATLYLDAAKQISCEYFILRGNHDVSRDTSKKSSFDLFKQLVSSHNNIHVVDEVLIRDETAFIPYNPFVPLVETIETLPDHIELLYMHHDFVDFGGDQVIPTELLASKGIFNVTNGHDHVARVEKRHGVTVEMTGSMQPYTHAEDRDEGLYRTVTLAELAEIDPKNLNIRVLLEEGEELPPDIDCLSLTAKRVVSERDQVTTEEFDTFDLRSALSDVLHPLVKDQVMEHFNDQ